MKRASATTSTLSFKTMVLACIIFTAIASLVFLGGCNSAPPKQTPSPSDLPNTSTTPESYDDVYNALYAATQNQNARYYGGDRGMAIEESESSAAPLADSSNAGATAKSASGNYSETNTQVAGIDEGDIVKTDGENIYMVSGTDVVLARADGADTKEIARISLNEGDSEKRDYYSVIYPRELYVSNNTLLVLYDYSIQEPVAEGTNSSNGSSSDSASKYYPSYNYRSVSEVACFDISNPQSPQRVKTFGQDGYYASSRLQEGILYLVTNYSIYNPADLEREQPITYIPSLYTDKEQEMIGYQDICILPDYDSVTYAVATSIDISGQQRIDEQSILGASNTLYMSPNNLYLAGSVYENIEENAYQDGSFKVTEYRDTYSTRISKLALDKGSIAFVADCIIPGTLINQFALDEYEGHLRAVTTVSATRYRILDDGKGEITDYQSYESEPTTNSLFVLDNSLQQTGSIEGLAADERVYSVRFDGPVGYFVTFRQTDPLFAVDLSNPAAPEIKSALKIPGFSTYMHVYDETSLFGLGMAANDQGRTQGMKMSMFDTENPYDISEKHYLALDGRYSEALYNHKAIIVDKEQNLIGFPAENGYVVYGYSDDEGFYLRQTLKLASSSYSYNMRGLYIDNYFYICSQDNIGIYELDSLEEVAQVSIEVTEPTYDYGPVVPLSPDSNSSDSSSSGSGSSGSGSAGSAQGAAK